MVAKREKIVSIEEIPYVDEYVYDLEVEDAHTFLADDIYVHNTDSVGVKDRRGRSKEEQRKDIEKCIKSLVEYIKKNVPFPFDGFGIDIETDEIIDYICFFYNKQEKRYMKKNYVMIHSDGKGGKEVEIKGLAIIKDNASKLGMHIFHTFLEKRIIEQMDCKFDGKEIKELIRQELEKDITLAAVAFNVNPSESYKNLSQIQSQISRGYLEGESGRISLVKNNRKGKVGKGNKYCTIEEAKTLNFDDLVLDKVWNELDPFIKEEKPIDLMSFGKEESTSSKADDMFEQVSTDKSFDDFKLKSEDLSKWE